MTRFIYLQLLPLLLASSLFSGEIPWLYDINEAYTTAQKEEKPMMLLFTGSDWCSWCIKLEEEVFSKSSFGEAAAKKFVLVVLDFPRDKSDLSAETVSQNERWRKKFEVKGFPTVFLADETGRRSRWFSRRHVISRLSGVTVARRYRLGIMIDAWLGILFNQESHLTCSSMRSVQSLFSPGSSASESRSDSAGCCSSCAGSGADSTTGGGISVMVPGTRPGRQISSMSCPSAVRRIRR